MSTKTGLILFFINEEISDDQVKLGTRTFPIPFKILKISIEIKFADDPELTNTEYFTPSQFDHFLSNS